MNIFNLTVSINRRTDSFQITNISIFQSEAMSHSSAVKGGSFDSICVFRRPIQSVLGTDFI